jgi:nucleotide-binding universal stress UspA family protein
MTVVVGFDGSDSGEDALRLGVLFSRAVRETPLVTTVYPGPNPIGMGRVDAEWVQAMREHAEETLGQARRLLEGQVDAEFRLVPSSSAAHGLDDLGEAQGARAIVVGSTRRGARRRVLAGSTAERLMHGAACAVAVAPRGLRERAWGAVRRIGVAYVDSREAREALRIAADLAERIDGDLTLFSVAAAEQEFSPVVGRDTERAVAESARAAVQEALEAALEGLPDGLGATGEVLEGDVVGELAALDERDVDLLVCGSRGYGPARRVLLGGVSTALVRRAAAPVMVVPRSAAADGEARG